MTISVMSTCDLNQVFAGLNLSSGRKQFFRRQKPNPGCGDRSPWFYN